MNRSCLTWIAYCWLVSDEFYTFVQGIENEVRKVLTINFLIAYYGQDIKEVILEKLNANTFI